MKLQVLSLGWISLAVACSGDAPASIMDPAFGVTPTSEEKLAAWFTRNSAKIEEELTVWFSEYEYGRIKNLTAPLRVNPGGERSIPLDGIFMVIESAEVEVFQEFFSLPRFNLYVSGIATVSYTISSLSFNPDAPYVLEYTNRADGWTDVVARLSYTAGCFADLIPPPESDKKKLVGKLSWVVRGCGQATAR